MGDFGKMQLGHVKAIACGALGVAFGLIGLSQLKSLPSPAQFPTHKEFVSLSPSTPIIDIQDIAANMNELPNEIFRRWGHSFEEDTEDITVYRPSEYPFPPARGRAGIEFRSDGEFIDWTIGPTDASHGISGHWRMEGSRRVRVYFENNIRAPRVLEIIQYDMEVLKVRQLPVSL